MLAPDISDVNMLDNFGDIIMKENKLHTALTVCIDVQGLRSFLARATLENLNGVNDNPVMLELRRDLLNFLDDLSENENASVFCDGVSIDKLCSFKIKTSLIDCHYSPAFFTVCDLLGYGLFTGISDNRAHDIMDYVYDKLGGSLYNTEAMHYMCRAVVQYAVPAGLLGAYTFARMESDLVKAGYFSRLGHNKDHIFDTYKSMVAPALIDFNAMVLPFIKLYMPMDTYLLTKNIN